MGATFLFADLSITPEVQPDHAQYLDHWLKVLKSDTRAILTAAAQAQRAADYLHELQPKLEPEPDPPERFAPGRSFTRLGGERLINPLPALAENGTVCLILLNRGFEKNAHLILAHFQERSRQSRWTHQSGLS